MNDERKTLAALLREPAVYEDTAAGASDPLWKKALLTDLDLGAALPPAPKAVADDSAPLRLRHLILMAPFGAALFLAGYWLGSEGASATDLARVHPMVWVAAALGVAGLGLLRCGGPLFRR